MKMHKSLTAEVIIGFCIACGCEADSCEPDAERYECEACGELAVYGAEELLLEMPWPKAKKGD